MKKKLVSFIAFALVLVMAMTSLPVGAALAASAEKVEQTSELHEHTEDECLDKLHEHEERYDNARELTKLWYEDNLRTKGTSDTELNNILNDYFAQREAAWMSDRKALDFDKRIHSSIVAINRERHDMIRDFAKRMGFDIVDSKVTVLFDDASVSRNVDETMTISAYEWTFFDYRYPNSSSIDTSGIGTWHKITFSKNKNEISVIMDEYDESDMFGICTIQDSTYKPIATLNMTDDLSRPVEKDKEHEGDDYATRYAFYTSYNVSNVVSYADQYWYNYNPAYANFNDVGGDCANYTSQSIFAGGMPQVVGTPYGMDGWYYKTSTDRSATWTSAWRLRDWMAANRGKLITSPSNSQVFKGSPVFYNDDHATICVGRDSSGTAIINSHNYDKYHVVWNYWGSGTTYYTVQLTATDPATTTCATPSISVSATSGGANVTLASSTSGATIYYTTNGSNPTTSSTKYNGAFKLTETKTVKAIAVKSGYNNSAVASKAVNIYTVTFKNWDGSNLKTDKVYHGASATPPSNPTRPGYTFTKWDKAYNNVTANLTVTAVFTINKYTVIFKNWDGTELKRQTVNHGSAATPPTNPTRPGYTFTGWDKAFNNIVSDLTVTAVFGIPKMNGTSPVDLGAEFYAYIVNTPTGKYLTNKQPNIKGEAASESYNQIWKFRRQDNNSYAIFSTLNDACLDVQNSGLEGGTKVIAYTGGYAGTLNQKFYIYNTYGAYFFSPVHSSGKMFVDMSQTTYNVSIWGGGSDYPQHRFSIVKIQPINGDLPVAHTVTFKNWNGSVIQTQTVSYGGSATAPANPSRPGYMFTGWDKPFNNVTTDLVVTAQFAPAIPDKPVVRAVQEHDLYDYVEGWNTVYLSWTSGGSSATHYSIFAYNADTEELVETIEMIPACTRYGLSLPKANYKFKVKAINMTAEAHPYQLSEFSNTVTPTAKYFLTAKTATYEGHTYAVLDWVHTDNWYHAKALCERLGGHLPTITSEGENAFLRDLIQSGIETSYATFLGATDVETEGTWKWITGEEFMYSNWIENEPNNQNGRENYLVMDADSGMWNDVANSNAIRNVVVEFDYIDSDFLSDVLKTANFEGHTYTLYKHTMHDWNTARLFCETQGGTLVCINSPDEQTFLNGFISELKRGLVFIGATDEESEGEWKWLTGEPFDYENWLTNQPDDTNGGEDYGHMRVNRESLGRWNDHSNIASWPHLNYQSSYFGYIIMETVNEPTITEPPTNPPVTEPPVTPDPSAPQIVVSSASAMAGSTVTVDVSLLNNPGIVSMALTVDFDEHLELVSVTDSGLIPGQVHSPTMGKPYVLCWVNDTATENFTADGVIATLTFEVPEDMPVGEYPITVSYDLDNYDIYNCDVELVEFAVVNGRVNVIDVLIGDVNTDTKVNALDRLYLTRFLAKWADYPEAVINMIAADVNVDTKVNALDRLILTRYLAKWAGYETLPYSAKSAPEAKKAETKGSEPAIVVDSVAAEPGETVTVCVSLEDNPGIVSMMLTVDFDEALELIGRTDTGLLPGQVHSPTLGNPYTLCWVNDTATTNYTVNGSLVELTFKLSENAEPGTYPITITYDLDNYDIYNCDVELVEFEVVNGGVTYEPDEPATHTVTFIDPITGEVIAEVEVEHGEAAEAPEAPAHEWYTFTGWDADFSEVIEDITVTAQYTELGDINGDGTVDMRDALQLMRWLIGSDELACDEAEADFNSDGKTDLMDALLLMRHILGTI